MSAAGKRVWIVTLPYLMAGVVGGSDSHLISQYCEQVANHQRMVAAQSKLDAGKELPFLTKGRHGEAVVSPYVREIRHAAKLAATLGAELGLSPSARARIGQHAFNADSPAVSTEDPWNAFQIIQGGRGKG